MKELAFQTTSSRDEAVESPGTPNPIDSAITINSTSEDRDAKMVNATQLKEGAELPEIIKVQSIDPCTDVFDRTAIAKHDETEEEMGLDRLAVVDQDLKVDWEYARMNKHHVAVCGGSELVSAEIWRTIKKSGAGYFIPSQLLLVCRESHDFFLEHYSIMDLQSLPGNEVISDDTNNSSNSTFHAWSRGYIDAKSDTLVIRNLQVVVKNLLFFNMHLNLNPDYWGGIEFETSLLINFQPDYDFYVINRKSADQKDLGGDSILLITRADSYSGTISLYFEDWMDDLPVFKDETFYNNYGLKELFEEHESATRYDYDQWPWNDPRTIQDMD
ncbi:hypothetical protein BOTNAR_0337g00080 [Botryotinia narcissicola]|uniref:Uncharacterized protein n=1 Tax=Botryotinia narcissicola TaxID=278944 RepID=A0A4Z1HXX1_9HELO|nr:hypothetical protein BOTNAR_0337g00080 [Botryotinia narcissicola]